MDAKVVPILTAHEAKEVWTMPEIQYFTRWNILQNFPQKAVTKITIKNGLALSVHHAAQTFCNVLLQSGLTLRTQSSRENSVQDWYPSS